MITSLLMGGCLSTLPIYHFSGKSMLDGLDVVSQQEEFDQACSDGLVSAALLISSTQSLEAVQSQIRLIERLWESLVAQGASANARFTEPSVVARLETPLRAMAATVGVVRSLRAYQESA
jgi:hypothetical protein